MTHTPVFQTRLFASMSSANAAEDMSLRTTALRRAGRVYIVLQGKRDELSRLRYMESIRGIALDNSSNLYASGVSHSTDLSAEIRLTDVS
jgi:hypothetical protein